MTISASAPSATSTPRTSAVTTASAAAPSARTSPSVENAVVTGLLTSLFAGTRLFPGGDVTSARAAFQDALYGRTVLVDLRPAPARATDGELGLDAVVLDTDHGAAATAVRTLAESSPVTLVSTDGVLATRIATQLRTLGLPWVHAVDGGFAAWRAAGLPAHHTIAA